MIWAPRAEFAPCTAWESHSSVQVIVKTHFNSLGHWLFLKCSLAMPGRSNKSFSGVNWHMICSLSSGCSCGCCTSQGLFGSGLGCLSDMWWGGEDFLTSSHGVSLEMVRKHCWHLLWLRTEEWAQSCQIIKKKAAWRTSRSRFLLLVHVPGHWVIHDVWMVVLAHSLSLWWRSGSHFTSVNCVLSCLINARSRIAF